MDLSSRPFDDDFLRALPVEASGAPHLPRSVANVCASLAAPEPVPDPRILAWSDDCGQMLGLPAPSAESTPATAQILVGNQRAPGSRPYAMRYGGHQFGNWADQLGDGRVINLGELAAVDGRLQTLQLKGAGRTPYSRGADGRAVLRSSLREFVLSEAMFHLGVPTTRALALVATGQPVERDMLYDGHPRAEPGAIVTRVAPSFVRLGNFELHAAHGELDTLRTLLRYCMDRHWPELGDDIPAWYADVCARTARTLAHWMTLGFVHGVMNTDNLSILGLTMDYGPFGWLEPFDPGWTPNTTDAQGRRYCFGRQPQIAQWNLGCLGGALLPLGVERTALESGLQGFHDTYNQAFRAGLAARLGLNELTAADEEWLQHLLALLQALALDYTLFFRDLPRCQDAADFLQHLQAVRYGQAELATEDWAAARAWFVGWQQRVAALGLTPAALQTRMDAVNPAVVPRNWILAQTIDAAEQGDLAPLQTLMSALRTPFQTPVDASLCGKRPSWAENRPGCSMLSCSS